MHSNAMRHLKYHFRRTLKGNMVGVNGVPLVGGDPESLEFDWGVLSEGSRMLSKCVLDHYFQVRHGEPELATPHYAAFWKTFFRRQQADNWILDSIQIKNFLMMRME